MTVQHTTLANGFQIVTEPMAGLQSASIGIWVQAGGRHETLDQNGLAHFLEHMAFKGTKTRSALSIAEAIEDVGGFINAYTSREVTAYYARVLQNDVPMAFNILADILQNSSLDAKEIEIERGVILQEIGQSLDTPDDVIFDWLQETAYPNQALGRSILGPSAQITGVQREDLVSFISQHYSPDRMILAAAGAVDHDQLVRMAEASFGAVAKITSDAFTPARFQAGDLRREKKLEQAHIALAFESPNYLDKQIHTAQIYALALGGGMSSRLFQKIRENLGLCYTIFAQAGAYSDTGMTTIYAGTSAEQLPDLATLTIDELKRAAEDISAAELDRARAQMKAGMLMGLESASNRAERLARMVQIWGYVPSLDETVARIDAVGLADLKAYAEHIAVAAPAALALYGPVAKAPSFDVLEKRRAA